MSCAGTIVRTGCAQFLAVCRKSTLGARRRGGMVKRASLQVMSSKTARTRPSFRQILRTTLPENFSDRSIIACWAPMSRGPGDLLLTRQPRLDHLWSRMPWCCGRSEGVAIPPLSESHASLILRRAATRREGYLRRRIPSSPLQRTGSRAARPPGGMKLAERQGQAPVRCCACVTPAAAPWDGRGVSCRDAATRGQGIG
jgi:hypothetical protein